MSAEQTGAGRPAGPAGKVRIIGGAWRRRMLSLPPIAEVRPTPDRVRETLFNWLAPSIGGARCLDAFAGTGALGFEAASRGAASVVLLDTSAAVVAHLTDYCRKLDAGMVAVEHADAVSWLDRPASLPFDVIFLDPPFGSDLGEMALQAIAHHGWLTDDGMVYFETGSRSRKPALPEGWSWEREKRAGRVRYYLASRG